MTDREFERIADLVSEALVTAGSTFREDKKDAYRRAIEKEDDPKAKWVLGTILENAEVAGRDRSPLCDDTGVPHLLLELGDDAAVSGRTLDAICEGVRRGLRTLPGRPMAIMGDDAQRIDQSGGLSPESEALEAAPILLRRCAGSAARLHILMFGGGPAIRAKTYRVFHKHSVDAVLDEIVEWAADGVSALGCSPCTLAVGVGRSHYGA